MYYLEAACRCDPGRVRLKNEDNLYFNEKILLVQNLGTPCVLSFRGALGNACFGVFDGMGGEQQGEQAAFLAAQALRERLRGGAEQPGERLKEACFFANRRICAASAEQGGGRMGSTAAMLHFTQELVWLCNIGDSKIFRHRKGELTQLSVDHTDQAFLKREGITNRKPSLTQHLGIWPEEMEIEPYLASERFKEGDLYLLCSDGLTDMLSLSEIAEILSVREKVEARVDRLIDCAIDRGGRDNVTVILSDVRSDG